MNASPSYSPDYSIDVKRVLASTWQILGQAPPPSLREILAAYNAKGDGDRDMLLAMLNAKSTEDQRLASVASLQRTMLETFNSANTSQPQSYSGHELPHLIAHTSYPRRTSTRRHSPSRYHPLPSTRDTPPASLPPRKRHRSSRSPSPTDYYYDQLPPSPRSPSSVDPAEYSPRSRASIAIGSLLSNGSRREHIDDVATACTDRSKGRVPVSITT